MDINILFGLLNSLLQVFFYCCGANECLDSFSLVLFYCIFLVLEFVKVSLFSVFWFACFSLFLSSSEVFARLEGEN
jgi:hypothetical protein